MLSRCFLASSKCSFASSRLSLSLMTRAMDFLFLFKGKGGETTELNFAAFWKVVIVGLGVSTFEKQANPLFSNLSGNVPLQTAFTRASATLNRATLRKPTYDVVNLGLTSTTYGLCSVKTKSTPTYPFKSENSSVTFSAILNASSFSQFSRGTAPPS